jgi:hypothetical protein
VKVPAIRGTGGIRARPSVGGGIVFPTGIKEVRRPVDSTPHNHDSTRPDRSVRRSRIRRVRNRSSRPSVGARIVSPACVHGIAELVSAAPYNHYIAGPNCGVFGSCLGHVRDACPTVAIKIVSSASIKCASSIIAAPDDHLTSRPYCRVELSGTGGVSKTNWYPTVGIRIVPTTCVQHAAKSIGATPDNHFAAGPNRRVGGPRVGSVNTVCGSPAIRAGIVFPTCVEQGERASLPAPDDHFSSGPNRRLRLPGLRWAVNRTPSVVHASATCYLRKAITNTVQ